MRRHTYLRFFLGKFKITHGEDKIIRVKREIQPRRFPGGVGTCFFNNMQQYKNKVAQVRHTNCRKLLYKRGVITIENVCHFTEIICKCRQ